MGPLLKIFKKKSTSIEDRIEKIKKGDRNELENFISDYTPFIIKTITKVTNRYIETENDDEYSIGLNAFNEALDRYEFSKGSFLKFAETVTRSRIYDYMRKNKSTDKSISIDNDENIRNGETIVAQNRDFTEKIDTKDQLERFKERLNTFNVTIEELTKESPKHIDTRLNAIEIARTIIDVSDIKEDFYRKKTLPASKIMEELGVSRKVLKGSRKFIIATALILDSDLDILKKYVEDIEGREKIGI